MLAAMDLDRTLPSPPPFVEVEVVYEAGRPGLSARGWAALHVHTKNHLYEVDWTMQCFRVVDRRTGEPVPDHHLLGAFLTGGQSQDGRRLALSHPLPPPGLEAVFEVRDGQRAGFARTSEVERIVLRVRMINVADDQPEPIWSELSGSFPRLRADQLK